MCQQRRAWATGLGLALVVGTATAQPPTETPLSAQALARCASEVHRLRSESPRLHQQAQRHDVQRASLAEQRRALSGDAASRAQYNARAQAFNTEMERFRVDVRALNALKAHYDQHCAQRPYRRADLEALPKAHRYAMRQGLGDVRVPFFEADAAKAPRAP